MNQHVHDDFPVRTIADVMLAQVLRQRQIRECAAPPDQRPYIPITPEEIVAELEHNGGNTKLAAQTLGISKATLYFRLQAVGLWDRWKMKPGPAKGCGGRPRRKVG